MLHERKPGLGAIKLSLRPGRCKPALGDAIGVRCMRMQAARGGKELCVAAVYDRMLVGQCMHGRASKCAELASAGCMCVRVCAVCVFVCVCVGGGGGGTPKKKPQTRVQKKKID